MSPAAKASLGEALVEYLILVLPVAFYVALESYHMQDFDHFYKSPEWSIATVFLQFQGTYLFIKHLRSRAERLSESRLVLLGLLSLTIVVASAMNALDSMQAESVGNTATLKNIYNNNQHVGVEISVKVKFKKC